MSILPSLFSKTFTAKQMEVFTRNYFWQHKVYAHIGGVPWRGRFEREWKHINPIETRAQPGAQRAAKNACQVISAEKCQT